MADDLFRAWLTGASVEDPTDTARPAGHKTALFEWQREDSGAGVGATATKGACKILLPNGVPCPLYAARLHLFGTLAALPAADPAAMPPVPAPYTIANAPRVLVRRDVTSSSATETCCYHTVISPTFVVRANKKWASSPDAEIAPGEYAELTFFDPGGNTATLKVGFLPEYTPALGTGQKLRKDSLVVVTLMTDRTELNPSSVPNPAIPVGTHVWSIQVSDQPDKVAPIKILSGTGASYVCDVYSDGPNQPATLTSQAITQLQIDGTETIPANTWAIGIYCKGSWYVQVPVWL